MNRLRELREDNDMNQTEMARFLNLSQTGYSKYETEVRDIPTDVLKKLADFYNTNIDYLLYRTDERKPLSKSIIEQEEKTFTDVKK